MFLASTALYKSTYLLTYLQLNTDNVQLVLWSTDAAQVISDARAYCGSPVFRSLTLAMPAAEKRPIRSRLRHSVLSSCQVLLRAA